MVEIKISALIKKQSEIQARKLGPLRNSILRGKGNVYGIIGQKLVAQYLKASEDDTFDYDLSKNETRLEVKTKTCSSPPKPEYECSISAANIKQDCDYYIFVRVHDEMKLAWILGAISKKCYFKYARFCKEGEVDEKSKLGWRFKADCYNLPISKLIKIEDFLKKRKI